MHRYLPPLLALGSLLALWSSPVAREASEPVEYATVPYAAQAPAFARALALSSKGKHRQAAQALESSGVDRHVVDYARALYFRLAGSRRRWRRLLEGVAGSDSSLAPRAALELAAGWRGSADHLSQLLQKAAGAPGTAGAAYRKLVEFHQARGDREQARESLERSLPHLDGPTPRARLVLDHVELLGERASVCERVLLHQLYRKTGGLTRRTEARLKLLWDEEWRELEFLRLLRRGKKGSWERALAARRVPPGTDFEAAMLKGVLARQRRGRRKAKALAAFDLAHKLASTRLRESIALYFKGRTLESLDRDMQAKDIYERIVRVAPEFPLARLLMIRIAQISLREGFPLVARHHLDEFLDSACPGEDLSEALWLAGFLAYLSNQAERAGEFWARLTTDYFYEESSPWVLFGPMSLYWRGRALAARQREAEAAVIWRYLAHDFPGDYYGLLSRLRLAESGDSLPAMGPARFDRSPLEVPAVVKLPPRFEGALELFRLGLWKQAFEELRVLVPEAPAPGAAALMLSSYLRSRSLADSIALRRQRGVLGAPWKQGARLWRLSLRLANMDAIEKGKEVSALPGALLAAIIRFESNYNPRAVSRAGAIGLLQVKHNTGNHVAGPCFKQGPVSTRELMQPVRNVELGSIYISELMKRHHDNWALGLAAFNAGPSVARWWLSRFTGLDSDALVEQLTYPNTVGYVKRILGVVPIYWSLFYPVLDEEPVKIGLPRAIPSTLQPFLDERGGRCDDRPDGK